MFRFEGKAVYMDGSEEAFEAGNVALAAWERYAMRHKMPMGAASPPTLSSLVIAHHALAIPEGFDAWAETVEGIELAQKGEPVTRKALLALLRLPDDAAPAAVEEAVNAAMALGEPEATEGVPPTPAEASTG